MAEISQHFDHAEAIAVGDFNGDGKLDVLVTDPLVFLTRGIVRFPIALGIAVALLALVMIVFGASSESRFIYTDF